MAMTPHLQLKQGQNLVMTQQLQQSIKLLQLSAQELDAFVEGELESNPMLARDEGAPEAGEPTLAEKPSEKDASEVTAGDDLSGGDVAQQSEALDSNFDSEQRAEEVAGDGYHSPADAAGNNDRYDGVSNHNSMGGEASDWEARLSAAPSLRDHLEEQLAGITDAAIRLIGSQLIGMLDESGYLREDAAALGEMLGAEPEQIEAAIQAVQGFEPVGVFASGLEECLALQLKDRGRFDPAMEVLIQNLDKVASSDHDALKKLCDVDGEDLAEMLLELRALNPKPAGDFDHSVAQSVVPEVFIRRGKDEGGNPVWQFELNNDALPRVLVNQKYYAELSTASMKKDDKQFVSEQMANANWLVKALDQRANTILKTAQEIVKQQEKFFLYGIQFLKPLTLKDVADAVDMHESTISRVTTQKYLHTPRGIFEMKYFFSSGVSSSRTSGDDVSSKTVMFHIKEFIDAEDPKKILSDDKLVTLLKGRGIEVARRTVAKYREAMHIPSSVVRRRQKKEAG